MVRSITLQNFKSFSEKQAVPLEPVTVLVGPNNSGKSNFMSVGRFVVNCMVDGEGGIEQEGGPQFLLHHPPRGDGALVISWQTVHGTYETVSEFRGRRLTQLRESLTVSGGGSYELCSSKVPLSGAREVLTGSWLLSDAISKSVIQPLASSRLIKLSLSSLRADSELVPQPELGADGAGMPSVLALWQGTTPEKREQLEEFLRKCLPEVRHVLVRPTPVAGYQRLWVRQADGEDFDAEHLSDGVLCFIALAMYAVEASRGQLLFVEEPEQYIHPRRLVDLVDLLREIVASKGCQFVLATHSPILLNAFRDEPEAILLFRRSETGTRVKRLQDIPTLREDLQQTPPGDLLAHGFFNEPF